MGKVGRYTGGRRALKDPQESFLDGLGLAKTGFVDFWQDEIPTLHWDCGVAPGTFHMKISGKEPMQDLIYKSTDLIYDESLTEWERLAKENKYVLTVFERGRSEVLSTALSERWNAAAFVLWSYCFDFKDKVPSCAAVYGIRKEVDTLKGKLFCYGRPVLEGESIDPKKLFIISNESLERDVLHVENWVGHNLSRLEFPLGTI